MLFKGVLIGLELREFDRMCAPVWHSHVDSRFGKNQSYEVLTLDRRYDKYHCHMYCEVLELLTYWCEQFPMK